ncbi:hypothetical protein CCACVL1_27382 [Corchorus capsularis]|uniref:Uncharacterized protein n=1 Tax=Corchorus capsularis TaxID=210143 RepID=A0A1R3GAJ5_COCAP|nr:hypothetical protein CCACVL1_27382 [Corchorus capsularis]
MREKQKGAIVGNLVPVMEPIRGD